MYFSCFSGLCALWGEGRWWGGGMAAKRFYCVLLMVTGKSRAECSEYSRSQYVVDSREAVQ